MGEPRGWIREEVALESSFPMLLDLERSMRQKLTSLFTKPLRKRDIIFLKSSFVIIIFNIYDYEKKNFDINSYF